MEQLRVRIHHLENALQKLEKEALYAYAVLYALGHYLVPKESAIARLIEADNGFKIDFRGRVYLRVLDGHLVPDAPENYLVRDAPEVDSSELSDEMEPESLSSYTGRLVVPRTEKLEGRFFDYPFLVCQLVGKNSYLEELQRSHEVTEGKLTALQELQARLSR